MQNYKKIEMILINSNELGFKKASESLNYGYFKSTGDILLFVHQDIKILDKDAFNKIAYYCTKYDFGIAGVAGIYKKDKTVYSSVIQGESQLVGNRVSDITYVDSVDECFFFIKRINFRSFDDLGNTWHMYAVNYSIKCHLNNEKVVVVPIAIYHFSPGWSLDDSYWKTVKVIGKKYYKKIKEIPTVFGIFPNSFFLPIYVELKKIVHLIRQYMSSK